MELEKIKELITKELFSRDFIIATSLINERDFESLIDLIDSMISKNQRVIDYYKKQKDFKVLSPYVADLEKLEYLRALVDDYYQQTETQEYLDTLRMEQSNEQIEEPLIDNNI